MYGAPTQRSLRLFEGSNWEGGRHWRDMLLVQMFVGVVLMLQWGRGRMWKRRLCLEGSLPRNRIMRLRLHGLIWEGETE
jgi:hypothetical protein